MVSCANLSRVQSIPSSRALIRIYMRDRQKRERQKAHRKRVSERGKYGCREKDRKRGEDRKTEGEKGQQREGRETKGENEAGGEEQEPVVCLWRDSRKLERQRHPRDGRCPGEGKCKSMREGKQVRDKQKAGYVVGGSSTD